MVKKSSIIISSTPIKKILAKIIVKISTIVELSDENEIINEIIINVIPTK